MSRLGLIFLSPPLGTSQVSVVDHYKISVIEKKTGEILSHHEIAPSKTYWTNYLIDEATKRSRKVEVE